MKISLKNLKILIESVLNEDQFPSLDQARGVYEVQPGDNLEKISKKTMVSVEELKDLNFPMQKEYDGSKSYGSLAQPSSYMQGGNRIKKGHSDNPDKLKIGGILALNAETSEKIWPQYTDSEYISNADPSDYQGQGDPHAYAKDYEKWVKSYPNKNVREKLEALMEKNIFVYLDDDNEIGFAEYSSFSEGEQVVPLDKRDKKSQFANLDIPEYEVNKLKSRIERSGFIDLL